MAELQAAAAAAPPESPDSVSLRELFFVKKAASSAAGMMRQGSSEDAEEQAFVVEVARTSTQLPEEPGKGSVADSDFRVSVLERPVVQDGSEEAGADGGGRFEKSGIERMMKVEVLEGASEEEKSESDAGAVVVTRLQLQRQLVHSQIEELQRIVTLQCRLTGSNPLAQELASAVLGTKGGKKAGNAISADALRQLQAVFSVKDTITKKEARDIGVMSGATLTQVREFFAAKRSQVRTLVQKCTDEAERRLVENADEQSQQTLISNSISEKDVGFTKLTDIASVETLLELMRGETYFSEQEKILQVILQTEPGLILRRFLEKGALKIIYGWLVAAAADEQTSILRQLLQVLSHLPMGHAVPLQLSSLLQPVNKLRFYFVSDVASRARLVMTKWSKLLMHRVDHLRPGASSVRVPAAKGVKDPSSTARILKKRERDAAVVVKGFEEQRKKVKTDDAVMAQHEGARSAMNEVLVGDVGKIEAGTLHADVKVSLGQPFKHKPEAAVRSKIKLIDGKDIPNVKLSGTHLTSGKTWSRREGLQSQQEHRPRVVGKPVLDEIASNKTQNAAVQKPAYGPSPSSSVPLPQVRKFRGSITMAEEHSSASKKVVGNIKSSSIFPVSEAANAATAVSRKRSLADQAKEKRKVLPVDDPGAGNRWRESTARRPVAVVDKNSRPLSADEIRKAKLRARIMNLPISGTSGSKSAHNLEPTNSRGKPMQVGDGWSLDRYTSMANEDVGGRSSQATGASFYRQTSLDRDATPPPRQILDDDTFDSLLAEQAAEAEMRRSEKVISIIRSSPPLHTTIIERESISDVNEAILWDRYSDSSPTTSPEPSANLREQEPLSPSIAVALSAEDMDTGSLKEDDSLLAPASTSEEQTIAPVTIPEITPENIIPTPEIDSTVTKVSENIISKGAEAEIISWIIPPAVNLDPSWGVAAGDASKERGVQAARVKREAEETYQDLLSVPANPKDLWDEEPVYDDTLTLEIPVEVPDNLISKPSSPSSARGDIVHLAGSGAVDNGAQAHQQMGSEQPLTGTTTSSVTGQLVDASNSAHDPNLLAILLNNPALVSQLTSQQNRNSSLDGLSALLEMVNKGNLGGLSVPTYAAGLGDMAQSRPGVSSGPASGSQLSGQLQLPTMEQNLNRLQPQAEVLDTSRSHGNTGAGAPDTTDAQVRNHGAAGVSSWDSLQWAALPPPPPVPAAGLPQHQYQPQQQGQQGHPFNLAPPPHGASVPLDHNGSWQDPSAAGKVHHPWGGAAPINNHVQTNANQFDSLHMGRGGGGGRPPPPPPPQLMSQNVRPPVVNGAASGGMMPELVDVTNTVAMMPWPPPPLNPASYPNTPHHNAAPPPTLNPPPPPPFSANFRGNGNGSSSWYQQDSWGRPMAMDQQQQALPGPPPLPPLHLANPNPYWQPQPQHHPPLHFRHDSRSQQQQQPPPLAWHPNAGPRGGHPTW